MNKECVKYSGLLSAYVDGELSCEEEGFVRSHLERCDSCSESVREIRRIKELLSSKSLKKELPEQLNKRILKLLNGFEEKQRPGIKPKRILGFRRARAYQGMAIAASLLMVVFFSVKNTNSSVLKACIIQHQKCIEEGQHLAYQYKTKHTYAGEIEKSLNLKPAIPAYFPAGYEFVCGDTCLLSGHNMAHMVYRDKEKLTSFFQSREPIRVASFAGIETIGNKKIKFGKMDGFNYAYWNHGDSYCLIVGDINRLEIKNVILSIPDIWIPDQAGNDNSV